MYDFVPLDDRWDLLINGLPGAHLLQTKEWAEVKAKVGWNATPLVWRTPDRKIRAAALVLTRTIRPLLFGPSISVCYVPRGPMLDWHNPELRKEVIEDLEKFAGYQKAIFIKMDPELRIGTGVPGRDDFVEDINGIRALDEIKRSGWRFSNSQVQFRNTVFLDLTGSEENWLQRMKQKTRYNLRLARRNGVIVREANESEYPDIYKMYAETSIRDGFMIRPQQYYLEVWQTFKSAGMMTPLIAEFEGDIIAGLILFYFGKSSWYLYGMSTGKNREKMPNYLLQWEAMRVAKSHGCVTYDLWGAPDDFSGNDSMTGVFRFKEGLGGTVVRTIGAWDYVISPIGYWLFEQLLPRIQSILRRNRKKQTQQEVSL